MNAATVAALFCFSAALASAKALFSLLSALTVVLGLETGTRAQAPRYDLLLKSGHVIDPANHLDGVMDVAVVGGKIYLGAYAHRLGATGLTFYDDEVTDFFSPHVPGQSAIFLTAVGVPAKRRLRVL